MRTTLLGCLLLITGIVTAQNVRIQGTIANPAVKEVDIYRPSRTFMFNYFKEGWTTVPVVNGRFTTEIAVDEPEIAAIVIEYDTSRQSYRQPLFLQKGYDLYFTFTTADKGLDMTVKGKGAEDNRLTGINNSVDYSQFYKSKDTLPDAIYQHTVASFRSDSVILADYVRTNKPSAAFTSAWKWQMIYYVPESFYDMSENYKYSIREAYKRNQGAWQTVQDKLMSGVVLSNDQALVSPVYLRLLRSYLLRSKEKLWVASGVNRQAFLLDWYGPDTVKGLKSFNEDMENLLRQKIIERRFTGRTKEYMYALLFETSFHSSNIKNMDAVYADFKDAYPNSRFLTRFKPEFASLFDRAKRPLTDKMVFVKNGGQLRTWESVLEHVKGKTVLLDMWGTWCGPCREEMEKNGAAIKTHFKDKALDYLYIANRDEGQDKKWKELIAYFNLEGEHILANAALTEDIMKKTGGTGFPTYVIIHRDGRFELSRAGYPMNRQKLIEQLEAALQ